MPEGMNRYRISVLVIDDRAGLCRVVGELLGNGIAAGQIGVLGIADTLDDMAEATATPPQLRRLLTGDGRPLDCLSRCWMPPHVDGRCASDLARVLALAGHSTCGNAWLGPAQARQLAAEAERGALVLLASAATAEQHARIGRILLRHGRHDLQTHEFSRPRAPAG